MQSLVWVANYHRNSLSQIDPKTNQIVGDPLRVPFAPEWMTSGDGKLWVFPSPYAENNIPQNFQGVAEFDTAHTDKTSILSMDGLPMDGVVSAGSLWVTTQEPNQVIRVAIE